MIKFRSTVPQIDGDIAKPLAEPVGSAAIHHEGSISPEPRDGDRARPSSGFRRPAVTIRIHHRGVLVQETDVPAIEAERPEYNETFADDDNPIEERRAGPDAEGSTK